MAYNVLILGSNKLRSYSNNLNIPLLPVKPCLAIVWLILFISFINRLSIVWDIHKRRF